MALDQVVAGVAKWLDDRKLRTCPRCRGARRVANITCPSCLGEGAFHYSITPLIRRSDLNRAAEGLFTIRHDNQQLWRLKVDSADGRQYIVRVDDTGEDDRIYVADSSPGAIESTGNDGAIYDRELARAAYGDWAAAAMEARGVRYASKALLEHWSQRRVAGPMDMALSHMPGGMSNMPASPNGPQMGSEKSQGVPIAPAAGETSQTHECALCGATLQGGDELHQHMREEHGVSAPR